MLPPQLAQLDPQQVPARPMIFRAIRLTIFRAMSISY
jgi:hypothetical protein